MWQAVQNIDMRFDRHTHFVTVGQAIGEAGCAVPTCGREWIKTLQPVMLHDHWRAEPPPADAAWTTIANWRGYGSIEHDGVFYGQKAHSLRRLLELPRKTSQPLSLALSIHSGDAKDLDALSANGWRLTDPAEAAGTPDAYRRFIQTSRGEFGVAKSGYVASRCGWFSDRSACYLASGRPVVAQETGFSEHLPTGEGLFAFGSVEDAVRCIDSMNGNYEYHADAARRLAETHFGSDRVLSALLQRLGAIS